MKLTPMQIRILIDDHLRMFYNAGSGTKYTPNSIDEFIERLKELREALSDALAQGGPMDAAS